MNLIPCEDGLKKAEPFRSFDGDCGGCKHYHDIGGMTEGGICLKRHIDCGPGFTCDDWESAIGVIIAKGVTFYEH